MPHLLLIGHLVAASNSWLPSLFVEKSLVNLLRFPPPFFFLPHSTRISPERPWSHLFYLSCFSCPPLEDFLRDQLYVFSLGHATLPARSNGEHLLVCQGKSLCLIWMGNSASNGMMKPVVREPQIGISCGWISFHLPRSFKVWLVFYIKHYLIDWIYKDSVYPHWIHPHWLCCFLLFFSFWTCQTSQCSISSL